MNKISLGIAMAGLFLVTGTVTAAPEFNVDVEPAGEGRSAVWLSYLAESNVTALDFTVQLGQSGDFSADVRQCLDSLPKTHTGVCQLKGDTLRGVVYSLNNAPLTDTNIGRVVITPGSLLKAAGGSGVGIRGVDVTAVTPTGSKVSTSVRLNGQTAPPVR